MEEKCGSAAICFVAFLPDILDSKAEGRNKHLEMILSVAEKFKRSPYRHVVRMMQLHLIICFFLFVHDLSLETFSITIIYASKALKNCFGSENFNRVKFSFLAAMYGQQRVSRQILRSR